MTFIFYTILTNHRKFTNESIKGKNADGGRQIKFVPKSEAIEQKLIEKRNQHCGPLKMKSTIVMLWWAIKASKYKLIAQFIREKYLEEIHHVYHTSYYNNSNRNNNNTIKSATTILELINFDKNNVPHRRMFSFKIIL